MKAVGRVKKAVLSVCLNIRYVPYCVVFYGLVV